MTLVIKNIEKLFQPKYKNLDGKFWVQKIILKKYLKQNKELHPTHATISIHH
tara:strand:- start:91 stop:246 length:156 start_codon:yes stop_codon:yes gene_type:complete